VLSKFDQFRESRNPALVFVVMAAGRAQRPTASRSAAQRRAADRAAAIAATLEAVRMLDLATARYRSAVASRWGVTISDSYVMSNIAMSGGRMTPRDLARRLMISSGTLTTMIDRLEAAGYVERSANPNDRRSLLIGLTDRGRSSLFSTGEQVGAALDAALPAEGVDEVLAGLVAVATAIDGVTDALRHDD
jgi:DNA-binding MarR family transcriptional regulator